MGILRFVLAMLVVYSHTFEVGTFEHRFFGHPIQFYWGAFSVGMFYMISGYYMEKKLAGVDTLPAPRRVPLFYLDRAWRIYPTYLICFLISLWYFVGYSQRISLSDLPMGFLIANLTIIPTSCFYLIPGILFQNQYLIIPVSPSLALEEMFFILLPFIQRYAWIFATGSALVFATSVVGRTNAYTVSYVGLPGTLFLFLTGTIISRTKTPPIAPTAICLLAAAALIALPGLREKHLLEISTAYLAGALAVTTHSRLYGPKPRINRISLWFGVLSYPIFLLHWIAVDLAKKQDRAGWVFLYTLALALPVNVIEGRIQNARRAFMGARRLPE